MKMFKYILLPAVLLSVISCSKENDAKTLQDSYLMKTVGPAIAGETLEFAYAMATLEGKLARATASVNFAGAEGTGFDPNSYHTDSRGNDVGVPVASISSESSTYTAEFDLVDTVAATLRFSYVIPEEAKSQSVSITFTAESSTGEVVKTTIPAFKVSMMDIKRDLVMTNDDICYFSLETMQTYTEEEVIAQGMEDKIDLIYLYDAITSEGFIFGHALVSPATDERYLNGRTIPGSFAKNDTKIEKQVFMRDMHFTGEVPATFVDDIDLETLDLSLATNFILGISSSNSAFVESADGRYRAYLFFNEARSRKLTFGIKRLDLQ